MYKDIFLTTTDTVPGIGAPYTPEGESALYELKKRPQHKKIIIMVGTLEQARSFKEWNEAAEELAKQFWPGATTLALTNNLAIRLPDVVGLREVLKVKGPVYMTSANISGSPQLSLEEAKKAFPEIKEVYDFGVGSGKPSTIIRVEDGKVLR